MLIYLKSNYETQLLVDKRFQPYCHGLSNFKTHCENLIFIYCINVKVKII